MPPVFQTKRKFLSLGTSNSYEGLVASRESLGASWDSLFGPALIPKTSWNLMWSPGNLLGTCDALQGPGWPGEALEGLDGFVKSFGPCMALESLLGRPHLSGSLVSGPLDYLGGLTLVFIRT